MARLRRRLAAGLLIPELLQPMIRAFTGAHVELGNVLLLCVVAVSLVVSTACLVKLWRGTDTWLKKLRWSFIILIPVVGPVFYGGMYSPPKASSSRQSGVEEYIWRAKGW